MTRIPAAVAVRWLHLRHYVRMLRRPRGETSVSHELRREYGGWTLRPQYGLRRIRYVSPPTHYTRAIPAGDQDAAANWALARMCM